MAKWYYQCEGLQYGPITVTELKQLVADGRLQPSDRVRRSGMTRWARAKSVRGLFRPSAADVAHHPEDLDLADSGAAFDFFGTGSVGSPQPAAPDEPISAFDFFGGEAAPVPSRVEESGTFQVTTAAAGPAAEPVDSGPRGLPPEAEEVIPLAELAEDDPPAPRKPPDVPVQALLAPVSPPLNEVSGRAVDLRRDGTAILLDGRATLEILPGWLVARTVTRTGEHRETYLRLNRLDAITFGDRPATGEGHGPSAAQVLSFHVGAQSVAVAVVGDSAPYRTFLERVVRAGGRGKR